jgi:hypothetical protein
VRAFTHECFGDDFERELSFFQADAVLSSSAQVSTTLISSQAKDLTALILGFVKARSPHDTFKCISLCEGAYILSDNRMKMVEAMNKWT